MKAPIERNFVSEIDQFLMQFNKTHTKLSRSQQQEKAKYARIYRLRDTTDRQDEPTLPEWF